MFKKSLFSTMLCILLSIGFAIVSFADTPIIIQPDEQTNTAYMKNYADIPSGRTIDGTSYGFERLAKIRESLHGEPVTITSCTKLNDNQYQVVCTSANNFSNGTFIIDIFPTSDNELKPGYQLWFSLYDAELKKYGTCHVKKVY